MLSAQLSQIDFTNWKKDSELVRVVEMDAGVNLAGVCHPGDFLPTARSHVYSKTGCEEHQRA